MFVITNRNIEVGAVGVEVLGSRVNPAGPAELRLLEAVRKGKQWQVTLLPDGEALKNPRVKQFFDLAVHGLRADKPGLLDYDSSRNLHRLT